MTTTPAIHLCIQQPPGYVHALGLLDQARYVRYQLRRLGAQVSIAKNRLRHDAVNIIFGAHTGFDATLRSRYACIFFNLEQLGSGGADVSENYRMLLETSAVIDYDSDNLGAYGAAGGQLCVVPLLYAPYLRPAHSVALEERPIDLLFIGSLNERRRAWIARIEACGLTVSQFDGPLYGAERDQFIVQAKAVVNTPFYGASRFEQARVSHCLSLGTPVISERAAGYRPHPAFADTVHWLADNALEDFFTHDFAQPAFFAQARNALAAFAQTDPIDAYVDLLKLARTVQTQHLTPVSPEPWQPLRINLGSGKDYKQGWLNLDIVARAEPDLVLDLAAPLALPYTYDSGASGPILLNEGSVELINANNVLEHVPDLTSLMGNCLRLLKEDGLFLIEVPYEHAPSAWQDPTHVRAMNENSWLYYTDWFWYLGWFDYRFELAQFTYLDQKLQECEVAEAAFMRVFLRKIPTTLRERTMARCMQAELRLPDDTVAPDALRLLD